MSKKMRVTSLQPVIMQPALNHFPGQDILIFFEPQQPILPLSLDPFCLPPSTTMTCQARLWGFILQPNCMGLFEVKSPEVRRCEKLRRFPSTMAVRVRCEQTRWTGESGEGLHGFEERRWRHLDSCQYRDLYEPGIAQKNTPALKRRGVFQTD